MEHDTATPLDRDALADRIDPAVRFRPPERETVVLLEDDEPRARVDSTQGDVARRLIRHPGFDLQTFTTVDDEGTSDERRRPIPGSEAPIVRIVGRLAVRDLLLSDGERGHQHIAVEGPDGVAADGNASIERAVGDRATDAEK